MHLAVAVLANNASVGDDGLLYVSGGGWEHYTVRPEAPIVRGVFAGVLDFGEPDQPGRLLHFTVAQEGHDAGSSASMMIRSERQLAPFALPFSLAVAAEPPLVRFDVSDENGPLWSFDLPITVESRP